MLNDRNCFASEMLTPKRVNGLGESMFNNSDGAGETRETLGGVTIRVEGPDGAGAVTVSVTWTGRETGDWFGKGTIHAVAV